MKKYLKQVHKFDILTVNIYRKVDFSNKMKREKIISVAPESVLCVTPVTQTAAASTEPYSIVSPLYEIVDDARSDLYIGINRVMFKYCTI